jgi:N-acetylneuraminic acid mutarotase
MAYNPETREWRSLPASPKDPSIGAAGVWTGDELIICCGTGSQTADSATTVAYDPATNTWRRLADAPITSSYTEAVWTGEQMLVVALGGVVGYDPDTDSWTTYPPPDDGAYRLGDIAWTGEELIIWSREIERQVHPGIALSPTTGIWRTLPDPPAWPAAPDIVWTGERLVIWGGLPANSGGSERAVGSVYDPDTNSWSVMAEALPEPEPFEGNLGSQSMVWTGKRVLVSTGAFGYGVAPERSLLLAYDPNSDTWKLLDEALLPFRGGELLVMGDRIVIRSDRLYISPVGWAPEGDIITADYWSTPTTTSVPMTTSTTQPEIREAPPGWTITEIPFTIREGSAYATGGGWFFAWGGAVDRTGDLRSDGILIDIDTGEWILVPEAPISGRYQSSITWTGSTFVVFGGQDFERSHVDGATFDPQTREWTVIAPAPLAPAAVPAAVWDGDEVMVWLAGQDSDLAESPDPAMGQIATYDPSSDEWSLLPAPSIDMVDADLLMNGDELVLVGGPAMRDNPASLTRSLYGTRWSDATGEWTETLLGPGVDAARLLILPDGETGVFTDRGHLFALRPDGWSELQIGSDLPPEAADCWWDVGTGSGGGQAYLKLCGYDFRITETGGLETIIEPDHYGSTANLFASAFVVDDQGRLIVFGDSPLPSATGTPNALFGVFTP